MKYVAIWIVVITVIIFIFQNIFSSITDSFALVSADVLSRPWIIITHMFLHADISHIFYNMFALALFGTILEKIIDWKRFLFLYFSSGIVAAVGAIIFYPATIGASGAIFGILGTLAALRPKMVVWTAYVPMPMIVAAAFWAFLDVVGIIVPSDIANAAHLFGLAFGIVVGIFWRKRFREVVEKKKMEHISDKEFKEWETKWMR